jgi:ATP-dependent Clp protease, protease subunit
MKWYNLTAKADSDTVEVFIYDLIGNFGWGDGLSARQLIRDLQQYRDKKLLMRIDSLGGAVQDGITIYNYLKGRGNVEGQIDGWCASIATIVALACDKVTMAKNSIFMIHNLSGLVQGTPEQIRKYADDADKINDQLVSTYVDETGVDEKQVKKWMDEEKYFTAEEAKEHGFIDEIAGTTTLKNLTASALSRFRSVPVALGGKPAPQNEEKDKAMTKLLAALVAAGLLPHAKLEDDDAAEIFRAEFKKRQDADTENAKTIKDLEAKITASRKGQAESFVNAAAKSGRIKDDAALKGRWVEAYLKDEEGTKAMLESVEAKKTAGAPPVPEDGNDDSSKSDLEKLAAKLSAETDPTKRGLIAREMRDARGHKNLFA